MFVPFGGIADRQGGVRNYNRQLAQVQQKKSPRPKLQHPLELTTKLPYLKTKSRGLPRFLQLKRTCPLAKGNLYQER